jgi:hypothetical protein
MASQDTHILGMN